MSWGVRMQWTRLDGQVWEGLRVFRSKMSAKAFAAYWESLGTSVLGIEETDLEPGDNRARKMNGE